jgi:hypothetical protein
MGQQAWCVARYAGAVSEGQAQLESDDLRFRGDFRLTIPFAEVRSVEARDGVLHVGFGAGEADFEVGALADRWAEKIRHPRTLIDKLDVRPGARVAVLGALGDAGPFWTQLRARTELVLEHSLASDLDVIVLGVERRDDLQQVDALEPCLRRTGCIWVVAPRGQPQLTELDVLSAGRAAGLHDTKVARFSDTHTAHRFVIPRERR